MATASNFRITIHNGTNDEVKATRFEYRDGPAWRTEAMFGLDGHQKIEKGHGVVFTRDLEGVGGEETQFRVTYQHHAGGGPVRHSRRVRFGGLSCGTAQQGVTAGLGPGPQAAFGHALSPPRPVCGWLSTANPLPQSGRWHGC